MQFMLDTDICIYIIRQKPIHVVEKLRTYAISNICISSVTFAELEYGAAKSEYPDRNRDALLNFTSPLEIMPFDEYAAFFYGWIRSGLERRGMIIGAMDLMIAAHAMHLSCTLVSNNIREFQRVSGLKLENWISVSSEQA